MAQHRRFKGLLPIMEAKEGAYVLGVVKPHDAMGIGLGIERALPPVQKFDARPSITSL